MIGSISSTDIALVGHIETDYILEGHIETDYILEGSIIQDSKLIGVIAIDETYGKDWALPIIVGSRATIKQIYRIIEDKNTLIFK